ncbi:cupin domain-containing protein [Patescibacteria group bacterium]|nr:cupin domain-containing protein [Patescibacteria group bacterium]
MKKTPYVTNVEEKALANENFRQVLHTTDHLQLVAMSLDSGEDIGEEVHELDQFLRIEKGSGKAVLDGREYDIADGFAVLVPAGTRHNIINTGQAAMKLYTLYGPPDHREGVIHKTKADALADTTDRYEG